MAAATLVTATLKKNQYVQRAAFFTTAAVVMDNSGLQDIVIIDCEGIARIACRIIIATNALAAFAIAGCLHPDDNNGANPPVYNFVTLRASVALNFTSPVGILVDTSGDLTAQAVGTGWFILDCAGLSKIKLQANSSAAGGSSMTIWGGGL